MHENLTVTTGPEHGRTSVLRVQGRLDNKTAGMLIARCDKVRLGGHNLVLNLADVSFIASSGIGALLSMAEQFRSDSAKLGFAAVSPAVESVVALLNLDRFLPIYRTEEEALAALAAREAA